MKSFVGDSACTETQSMEMNNPSGTAFQQDAISSFSIDPEKKPQQKEKLQEATNIDLRSWLRLPYRRLLFLKIVNKTERRKIIAFAVVAGFMLFTFWNSLEQDQLQSDLKKATFDEVLLSGKVSVDDAKFSSVVVLYTDINEHGKPVIPVGISDEIAKQLQKMQFDPPKRNGVPVRVKIPITIGIQE